MLSCVCSWSAFLDPARRTSFISTGWVSKRSLSGLLAHWNEKVKNMILCYLLSYKLWPLFYYFTTPPKDEILTSTSSPISYPIPIGDIGIMIESEWIVLIATLIKKYSYMLCSANSVNICQNKSWMKNEDFVFLFQNRHKVLQIRGKQGSIWHGSLWLAVIQ